MTDAPYVLAAYGVVGAALGLYALTLRRRLAAARRLADAVARKARITPSQASRPLARADQHIT